MGCKASVFKLAMYLRGFENLLMDMISNEKLVFALIDKLMEFHLSYTENTLKSGYSFIDIFMVGDDFGTETGPLISIELFRKFFKKPLQKLVELGHKYGVKVMLHSCGSIRKFIPDFIEIGFDILNPIQTTARGMEPDQIKKEFGQYICFHGSIDVQKTLPFGKVEDVKNEVKEKIRILGKGGGFILAPSHNLQPDIPIENILEMYLNH